MKIRKIAIGDEVVELVDKNELTQEVNDRIAEDTNIKDNIIGDLSTLKTSRKDTVVDAINNCIQEAQVRDFVNLIYPIGSIYISVNTAIDPNTQFPGTTWAKITSGKFLENTTDAGQVGAEIASELPNITGGFGTGDKGTSSSWWGAFGDAGGRSGRTCSQVNNSGADRTNWNFNASWSNGIYGRSSTVQPSSLRCFIWKRTA